MDDPRVLDELERRLSSAAGPDKLSAYRDGTQSYAGIAGEWHNTHDPLDQERDWHEAKGATPALALCLALIRALREKGE